jgi:hypothetical protein
MPRASRECKTCGEPFRPRPEIGPGWALRCGKCRTGIRLGLIADPNEQHLEAHNKVAISRVDDPNEYHRPEPTEPCDAQLGDCRAAVNRAMRKLDEAKQYRAELVETVRQAATDAIQGLQLEPVSADPIYGVGNPSAHAPESAVAVFADWQLGKVTPSFNTQVLEERIERYGDALQRITGIQRSDHPVDELRVYLLGDLVEGEMIFPGQSHLIDSSLYQQVLAHGPRILGNFIRRALGIYPSVKVVGVIGNHGRLGKRGDFHPESNADAMMYEATRLVLAREDRLTWEPAFTPGERHWYAIDEVQGHRFFLFHGDQFKTPLYANVFEQGVLAWQNMFGFKYSLSGHYHRPNRSKIGSGTHWASGSPESDNTFAAEKVKAKGEPSQWLLFVHPRRGVSAEYEVKLA